MMTAMIPAWIDGALVPVGKLEAHQQGLRHKAVSVFAMCGNDVLIQRRALCKYHTPGLWANTCCTHPHWEENAEDCAIRRLNEELGLTSPVLEYRQQVSYRADVGNGLVEDEIVDVFLWRVADRIVPEPNPEEVMDTEWVGMDDLRRRIQAESDAFTPWLRIYLREHSEQIFA